MKYTVPAFIVLFCCSQSYAQTLDRSVIGSTGAYTATGNIQVTATAGEAVIHTLPSSSLIITQGFQQPDDLYVNNVKTPDENEILANVYPNPFSDQVFIEIRTGKPTAVVMTVYNVAGQVLRGPVEWSVNGFDKQSIDFSAFASGHYFIVLTAGNFYQSYKVKKE